MRTKRYNVKATQTKVGVLTGGIKENKPQIELNIGELVKGHNYQEVDGPYHGYQSLAGFEVFDGTALASSVAVGVDLDDTAREARRAAITKVGSAGAIGSVRGCFESSTGTVIAARNNNTDTIGKLWRTSALGWVEIPGSFLFSYSTGTGTKFKPGDVVTSGANTGTVVHINTESGSWTTNNATGNIVIKTTVGTFTTGTLTGPTGATAAFTTATDTLEKDGSYKFIKERFDLLTDLNRTDTVFFASGVYYPSYIKSNVATPILSHDLPDNMSTKVFATSIAQFKNRLWLGYTDGRLYFSNVGDPGDFDPTTFSGLIYVGDEIVDLKQATGDALIVFCKNSVQVIKALSVGDSTSQTVVDYLFSKMTLTSDIGCIAGTPQRVFDDLIYIDNRGVTSIEATQKFGDFETKSYSKAVQKTLLSKLSTIIGTSVDKELNQYRIYFNDGFGLIFTFELKAYTSSVSKGVKGITTFDYLTPISCVSGKYFGSTDGYVYKMDSGTSFNGDEIPTILGTSYYHYSSPSIIKKFKEVFFEGLIPFDLIFDIKANFDYRNTSQTPSTDLDELIIPGGMGAPYGEGVYGTMKYGVSENQTSVYYLNAYGINMSLYITTSNKFVVPHTLSSMIVQYSLNARKI